MMPEDAPVWRGYLAVHEGEDVTYEYDVKVGTPIDGLGDMPEPFAANAELLSKKRIDVVAETPDAIFIIEIKDEASWSAIGQALGYRLLYTRDFEPEKPVVPVVVARTFSPDLIYILTELQIPFEQVDQLIYA